MARKEQVKSRRKKPSGVTESIIDAAPSLARTQDWRALSLSDIADEAGVSLGQADVVILSKAVIVSRFMKRIDQHVLDGAAVDATESVRDRLFEVLTRRFDALAQHKCAVAAILGGLCAEPAAALAQTSRVLCSVEWILEAARVPSNGLLGLVRIKGLVLIYANALRVWLADYTVDMAKTMPAVDQGLRRAEDLAQLCRPHRRQAVESRLSVAA
jgi:AcrR family transcriptional regulator